MRSFIGVRVKAIHDGVEETGMVSRIAGDKIVITTAPGVSVEAPLDDADIYKADEADMKDGIEFIIEW